jgi:2-polyprenyl-3-methyl-5-hydroxy-6-metoxy-1,4-benzoquinol methylase
VGDICVVDLPANKFEVVVALDILEHLDNPLHLFDLWKTLDEGPLQTKTSFPIVLNEARNEISKIDKSNLALYFIFYTFYI